MANQTASSDPKRTAVLVVHGMGSQRPLDTVRGVVRAIWRDRPGNKVWFHPELGGTDIDLTVQTTSDVPGAAPKRRVDFHELYWAHLIAETRAIAVLLWLFELARRGPFLKRGMRPLWWIGATYLVFLLLSVTYLASQIVERLAAVENERISMMLTPLITTLIIAAVCVVWALPYRSDRIAIRAFVTVVGAAALSVLAWWLQQKCPGLLEGFATHALPAAFTWLVARFLMGHWAHIPFICAYLISFLFHFVKPLILTGSLHGVTLLEFVPWSLGSHDGAHWSSVAAWLFVLSYFVLSSAFLQPYLGDVARYLRNSPANVAGRRDIRRTAVDTLLALHESGKYDRIIVVAHSLGTMVAYDMLRATFARMFRDIPVDRSRLNPEFDRVDSGQQTAIEWRQDARAVITKLYDLVADQRAKSPNLSPREGPKAWLVTNFITLGSPLTHAQYLLCHGKDPSKPTENVAELIEDFERRIEEREFPACRPKVSQGDKVLTYHHAGSNSDRFHQAALFGLTRWTNIYFPLQQVFWGDAIGGPVAMYDSEPDASGKTEKKELFGTDVIDVAVSTLKSGDATFFTHTSYWTVDRKPAQAPADDPPHILALKLAVNLTDSGDANDPKTFSAIAGVRVTNPPP